MNNLRGDFLAAASVVLLGGTIWALFYVDFPDGGKDVLLVVIGALIAVVKDVYSFEFSTSKSGERSARVVVDTMKDAAATAAKTAVDLAAKHALNGKTLKAEDVKMEVAGDVNMEKKP